MSGLVEESFGHRYWPLPWQAEADRLADASGETFVEFSPERHRHWRNRWFPALEDGEQTEWRLHAALVRAMAPMWQAAIECVSGRLRPEEARLAMHAELNQVALQGGVPADRWDCFLNLPYAPWHANGRSVYNSLGMPIANVRAFLVRPPSKSKGFDDDNPEVVLAARRLARVIAALPDTLYHARHIIVRDGLSDDEIMRHCSGLHEIALCCADERLGDDSRDMIDDTLFVAASA